MLCRRNDQSRLICYFTVNGFEFKLEPRNFDFRAAPGAYKLIPASRPVGGFLVVGDNEIEYYSAPQIKDCDCNVLVGYSLDDVTVAEILVERQIVITGRF